MTSGLVRLINKHRSALVLGEAVADDVVAGLNKAYKSGAAPAEKAEEKKEDKKEEAEKK